MTPTEAKKRLDEIANAPDVVTASRWRGDFCLQFAQWVAGSPSPVHTQPTNILKIARLISDNYEAELKEYTHG
jgi:hypothetical protein